MKNFGHPLLSLAGPFLILLSLFAIIQREGSDQLQPLPALLVGIGLVLSSVLARKRRRQKLLSALRRSQYDENS